MNIYGHTAIVGALRSELPGVSLFVGPRSIGKWTTAESVAAHHGLTDVFRVPQLNAETSRAVSRRVQMEPREGRALSIIRVGDYSEQRSAQNILLKSLEEPRPGHFMILITHDNVAETVASRATRFDFGILPVPTIQNVLRARGFPEHEVEALSVQCSGRIGEALRMAELFENKPLVVAAMKAIQAHDVEALGRCADSWTPQHTETAVAWCYEAIINRDKPRLFSKAELGDMSPKVATKILIALRENHRPRLTVRGSLQSVLDAAS